MKKLSALQREVLAAVADGNVYQMERPPYTAYMKSRRRAVSSSVDSLSGLGLIRIGDRRERFIRYFDITEAGRQALAG